MPFKPPRWPFVIIILCAVLIVFFFGGLATSLVFWYELSPSTSSASDYRRTSVSLTEGTFVLLPSQRNQKGYDSSKTSALEVSATFDDYNVNGDSVKFYTGECIQLGYNDSVLPPVPRNLEPIGDSRLAFNYHYGDYPLYAAGGNSTLLFTVSGSQASRNSSCPMEIFLFISKANYTKFIQQNVKFKPEGFLNRSGCISIGQGNTVKRSTVEFPLKTPDSYFVAVFMEDDILIDANISGHLLEFKDDFKLYKDCLLTSEKNTCHIAFPIIESQGDDHDHHKLKSEAVCILALANDYLSMNVTELPKKSSSLKRKVAVGGSIAASGTGIIILAVIILVCIIIKASCKYQSDELQPLVTNADN